MKAVTLKRHLVFIFEGSFISQEKQLSAAAGSATGTDASLLNTDPEFETESGMVQRVDPNPFKVYKNRCRIPFWVTQTMRLYRSKE